MKNPTIMEMKIEELEELNADLLEALKLAKAWMSSAGVDSADMEGYRINKQFIVDTIAKAEGDTK
jgi:hypothetical protein